MDRPIACDAGCEGQNRRGPSARQARRPAGARGAAHGRRVDPAVFSRDAARQSFCRAGGVRLGLHVRRAAVRQRLAAADERTASRSGDRRPCRQSRHSHSGGSRRWTLQAHIGVARPSEHHALYNQAVELIARLQHRGDELRSDEFLPFGIAFDREKFLWELNFFVGHFLEGHYRGLDIAPAARVALDQEWLQIADELAGEPRVLCHRDYHSRNLMLHAGRLGVIDHQDARMGPDPTISPRCCGLVRRAAGRPGGPDSSEASSGWARLLTRIRPSLPNSAGAST